MTDVVLFRDNLQVNHWKGKRSIIKQICKECFLNEYPTRGIRENSIPVKVHITPMTKILTVMAIDTKVSHAKNSRIGYVVPQKLGLKY